MRAAIVIFLVFMQTIAFADPDIKDAIPHAFPTVTFPMMRDEFKRVVVGKRPEEVIQAVGKPERTTEHSSGDESWIYRNKTKDPTTEKVGNAYLHFKSGIVNSVSFH